MFKWLKEFFAAPQVAATDIEVSIMEQTLRTKFEGFFDGYCDEEFIHYMYNKRSKENDKADNNSSACE